MQRLGITSVASVSWVAFARNNSFSPVVPNRGGIFALSLSYLFIVSVVLLFKVYTGSFN